jgi:hypothetical protein
LFQDQSTLAFQIHSKGRLGIPPNVEVFGIHPTPPHPTHHQLIQWNIEKQGISYYVRWLLNFSMVLKNILPLINVLPIDAPKMLFTSQIMGDNIHVVCFRKVR